MKTFDAFEIHCNFMVSGITMCDTSKFLINKCKVYNRSFGCICIENIDRAKTVTEIQTYDETDHIKIIDWLINVKKWLEHDRDAEEKYIIYMNRNKSSFYTLELCSVIYWVREDCAEYESIVEYGSIAEYEPVEEVPIIKLPQKGGQFSFYTRVPGIYIKL